jgi:hypothetical protein
MNLGIRLLFVCRLLPCLFLLLLTSVRATAQDAGSAPSQPASAAPASTTPASATTEKPKKVFTNDDVAAANANPPNVAAKPSTGKPAKSVEGDPRLAQSLRARLQKLEPQLKDTEAQLSDLKKFAAGETDGSASRDFHRGINRTTVPEQIAKLEQKRTALQTEIDSIYEEARKKGILPGQLR